MTKLTLPSGKTQITEYDSKGNITKTVNERGLINTKEYDESDLVIKTVNETTGLITTNEYDKLGNLVKTSDNGGKTVTNKYDVFGQVIESTDEYGRTSKTEYDKYGQVTKEISATNEVTVSQYDKYGNVTKVTTPLGSSTVSTYDLLNRKLTDTLDEKKTLTYSYDARGQVISIHDSFTDKTDLSKYDGMGQVIETTDKLGNVSKTDYDAKGQVVKLTDALGHESTKEYDLYGNVIKETNALGHSKQTKYNALGLVVQGVDERGFSTSYKYNDKFQPVEVTDKLGKTAKFTYNAQGYVAKAINQNGYATTYEYDLYGQTVKETDPNGNIKTTEYDLLGNVIKSTEPNRTVINNYDDLGRLVSTKRNNKTTVTNAYNELNQITKSTNALGYATEYEYDEFDQLTTLKSNKDRKWNYEYDAEGDRIYEEKIVLNRYALEYEKDSEEWYDYVQTLPFEEMKQLLSEKDSKETFDALRYQLKYRKQNGLCVSNLAKDADANSEDCTYTNYTLDKTVEDALILSSGDDFNIYGEERIATESEEERLTYIGSLNQSVMQTVKDDLKKENPKQTLSTLEYDDAGNTLDIKSGFGYNGEKLDETGNIYLRARHYNPRIGQFVQIDSNRGNQQEVASQQRYTYVLNNQYKYIDRNGNFPFLGAFLVGALLVGLTGSTAKPKRELSDKKKRQIETAVKNNDLGSLVNSKIVLPDNTDPIATNTLKIDTTNSKDTGKGNPKPSSSKPTLKEVQVCPYKYMTLVAKYSTIFSCIYNSAGDGRGQARYRVGISKFSGEPLNLLNYATNILYSIRGYAINEKYSQYQSSLSLINTFSKSSYYLGGEFKTEVTKHANNMYKRITSNSSPYGEAKVWISDGVWKTTHPHKSADAYNFLNSSGYKNAIEFGEFTNKVMPIVSDILTGYIIYKKFITDKPNSFNGNYQGLKYPGNNPAKQPAPGYEWRGSGDPSSGKGNWYNPVTKEMLHTDLKHPAPIGPHWDYTDPLGVEYRLMPNGLKVPKYGGN